MNRIIYIFLFITLAYNVNGQHFVSLNLSPIAIYNPSDSAFSINNYIKTTPAIRLNYKLLDKNSGFGIQAGFLSTFYSDKAKIGLQISLQKQLISYYRHKLYIGLGPSVYKELAYNPSSTNSDYEISWICPNVYYFYQSKKKRTRKKKNPWALSISLSQNYTKSYGLYFGYSKYIANWKRKSDCNCPNFH